MLMKDNIPQQQQDLSAPIASGSAACWRAWLHTRDPASGNNFSHHCLRWTALEEEDLHGSALPWPF